VTLLVCGNDRLRQSPFLSASRSKELAIETSSGGSSARYLGEGPSCASCVTRQTLLARPPSFQVWADVKIDYSKYKVGATPRSGAPEDLFQALEDHSVNVSSMKSSPYYSVSLSSAWCAHQPE